jgi:hypothetical protein
MLKRIVDLTSSSSNISITHFWALMLEENQKYILVRRVYQVNYQKQVEKDQNIQNGKN